MLSKQSFRAHFADFEPVSKHKMYTVVVPAFYGDRFGGKEGGFQIYKPSSQELGDKIVFCYMRIRTLNSIIQNLNKIKIQNI